MSFFRSPGAPPTATPVVKPQYSGLQVQTASSALPIPIVYGRTRVAPNIVWAGNFQSHPQYSRPARSSGGGGKGGLFSTPAPQPTKRQITGYTYSTSLMLGLCEGPIASLVTAYNRQSVTSPAGVNCGLVYGATPQSAWSYLGSIGYGSQALAYNGTALAVSTSFDLGSSASIGSLSFEVGGLLYASGTGVGDADPAAALSDYLTSAQYGVGFPAASIDGTALYGTYQTYCSAHGLAFSPCLTDQETANATLTRWLQITNANAVWSAGRLKILPYDDNAVAVYDLTDDDFVADKNVDPVIVTRSDPSSAANVVSVEALDRANQYSPTTVTARDQGSIEQTGLRTGTTVSAHEFCDLGIAALAAQLILQRGLYVRNTYAFKLSWEYCLLEPMDIVTLTDAGLGLAHTPVRITEIVEDEIGLLAITAEEYPGQVGTSAGFAVTGASGQGVDRGVVPAPINPPVIIEPPSDLTNGAPQIWAALSGGTGAIADPNWGGAVVFASVDNATYLEVGSTTGPSSQGVLTTALGALPGSAGDTVSINFAQSGATIVTGSQPTLIAIDGEIMSFASATLTAASTYTLGGLKRAIYGQHGGAHAIGAQAIVLDTSLFIYTLPLTAIGVPLWFKFASVNVFGHAMQDLSTCTAYQVTPVGSGLFGPVAQAIATGTSLDEGLGSTLANETDNFGLASDPYVDVVDMGRASEASTAAAAGANSDITSLGALQAATINKTSATGTAAITYRTAGSTRALEGLIGTDDYQLKVSPDGAVFSQVYVCDRTTGNAAFKALLSVATYTVATLPVGIAGALAFASNGRKTGEAAGAGTGVIVAFSNGQWRRFSDDTVVAA